MRRISRYLPILVVAFFAIPLVTHAQGTSFDLGVGFGTNVDGSNRQGIDNENSENAFGSCTPNSGDTDCQETPALGNFFMSFGGDVMFRKHLGLSAEGVFQPETENYGPLTARQTFYDFNAVVAPINQKRVVLKLYGGAGGAKSSFYLPGNSCVGTAVCVNETEAIGDSNHFAVHVGVGIQLYVTEHIFIRPQFDYRYVPGFHDQYSSDSVPGGEIWIGYSFGER